VTCAVYSVFVGADWFSPCLVKARLDCGDVLCLQTAFRVSLCWASLLLTNVNGRLGIRILNWRGLDTHVERPTVEGRPEGAIPRGYS